MRTAGRSIVAIEWNTAKKSSVRSTRRVRPRSAYSSQARSATSMLTYAHETAYVAVTSHGSMSGRSDSPTSEVKAISRNRTSRAATTVRPAQMCCPPRVATAVKYALC
jgi:hypothetical protein